MTGMPNMPTVVRASFAVRGGSADEVFDVHFNPQTLQYTITNNLRNTGSGNARKQYVSDSTGKLTMDLVFDTTDTGEDVRLHTVKVARLMEPRVGRGSGRNRRTPPVVDFSWGLYTFGGMVESYNETLDFFSADGVPLRAAVNLTLASQDRVFEGGSDERRAAGIGGARPGGSGDGVQVPGGDGGGRGVTDTATAAGNPAAAREIAARNGIENIRFPGPAPVELDTARSPAAAASMTVGGSASAPIFAGLRQPGAGSGAISLDHFLRPPTTARLGTEDPATFALGGRARLQGGASFKAEVGRAGALKSRLEFDGEQ